MIRSRGMRWQGMFVGKKRNVYKLFTAKHQGRSWQCYVDNIKMYHRKIQCKDVQSKKLAQQEVPNSLGKALKYIKHTHTTYANMRSALSFKTGVGAFAHWKRNWRNSGHWLFPSSSIRLRATSAATSQTFLRIESDSSCCTASSTCSFSCCCPSGGSCRVLNQCLLNSALRVVPSTIFLRWSDSLSNSIRDNLPYSILP